MELTGAKTIKRERFNNGTKPYPLEEKPLDRGEVIESYFFLIPRILPYEGNGNRKRLFWLKTLAVRVKYSYTYSTRVLEVDESGWDENRVIISVPWFSARAKTEALSATYSANTDSPPGLPRNNRRGTEEGMPC